MKKLNYTIILLLVLSICAIVSCADSKNDDHTPPEIAYLRFNIEDTIRYNVKVVKDEEGTTTTTYDSVYINNEEKHPFQKLYVDKDILLIGGNGHSVTLSGEVMDDKSLSALTLLIWGDSLDSENIDDISYRFQRTPMLNMYGQTARTITNYLLEESIPEQIRSRNKDDGNNTNLPVRESDIEYHFKAKCIDSAGNQDSIVSKNDGSARLNDTGIVLLSRESLMEKLEAAGIITLDPATPIPPAKK